MTLTGALLAVFVQQWAQSYLQATQERAIPRNRARIRTYYYEGIKKWYLPRVTRAVPTLIHVSLILFFAGLPVFLFILNRTVFDITVTWMVLCVLVYACITLIPILSQESPYHSPLSYPIWWCVTRMHTLVLWLLEKLVSQNSSVFRRYNFYYTNSHLGWPSSRSGDMRKVSQDAALEPENLDIGYRALNQMFETLNDDDEFEQLFDALPGLSKSKLYQHNQSRFLEPAKDPLSAAWIGLMHRTLSSSLVPEDVKQRRIIICTRALRETLFKFIDPQWILSRVLEDWRRFLVCIEFGLFVQDWKDITAPVTQIYAQCVVASIISSVKTRDNSWFRLASGHLRMSKSLIQDHCAHGDSVLLANVIDIISQICESYYKSKESDRSVILDGSAKTLELVCKLNVRDTHPYFQHAFCAVWNQLIDANTCPRVKPISMMTLKNIRRLYMALHEGTPSSPVAFSSFTDDGASVLDHGTSYAKCTIDQHHPHQTVLNLRSVGPFPNVAGNTRSHSSTGTIITTPSMSSVFVSALSSLRTMHHVLTPVTSPSSISSTDHISQMTRTRSGDVPTMAEPAVRQDIGISRSSSRFTPEAPRRGSVEEPPSPSPSFRSALTHLSVSSPPQDETSCDLLGAHIHSPQTG